jgi:hypothetical protein
MKKITYIITVLLAALALYSCAEDPIDRRLSSSDFFVTFETHNAVNKSLSITEGDTVVVTITVGATVGNPLQVSLDVTPPSSVTLPASAAYELLNLDNTPLTVKALDFMEGTGSQSFKFVATDNDDIDGSRTFTLKITGVSNDYRIGVNATGEGATLPVTVKDDEVVILMSELVGEWEVTERQYYTSAWHDEAYTIVVDSVVADPTALRISKITGKGGVLIADVTATVDLSKKVKTIYIPAQEIDPPFDVGFITYVFALNSTTFMNNVCSGDCGDFKNLIINKADDGKLSIDVVATTSPYSWCFFALNPDGTAAGYYWYSVNTKWTKQL